MAETTAIEWTQATWNPWVGCRKVSQGCKHCYMFRDQERFGQDPTKVRQTAPATFRAPLKWKEPKLIFTCSWSDFFIEEADAWRPEAWKLIRKTPHHTYQILTKRPERILECLPADWGDGYPNVWIGVTVEDQAAADKRIPLLLEVPAVVRFLSCEPLLGAVDLNTAMPYPGTNYPGVYYALSGAWWPALGDADAEYAERVTDMPKIDWVIAGGESGPNARPMHPDWARALRDQCKAAGVAFFFKQWGVWKPISEIPEAEHEALYHPAPAHDPEATRRCKVETAVIRHDGKAFGGVGLGEGAWELTDGHASYLTFRMDKAASGRLLDGRTWDEMPK